MSQTVRSRVPQAHLWLSSSPCAQICHHDMLGRPDMASVYIDLLFILLLQRSGRDDYDKNFMDFFLRENHIYHP